MHTLRNAFKNQQFFTRQLNNKFIFVHPRKWFNSEVPKQPSQNNKSFNNQQERKERAEKLLREKNRNIAFLVVGGMAAFLGLGYAAVPIYQAFCAGLIISNPSNLLQVTGIGGTTQDKKVESLSMKNKNINVPLKPITVTFVSTVSPTIPWKFEPEQNSIEVIPGEATLALYRAKNLGNEPVIGFATYNVTPFKVGPYFNKVQCFCFEEQRLNPGEEVDMPVFFYISPEILTDANTKEVDNVILSYTFFKSRDYEEK